MSNFSFIHTYSRITFEWKKELKKLHESRKGCNKSKAKKKKNKIRASSMLLSIFSFAILLTFFPSIFEQMLYLFRTLSHNFFSFTCIISFWKKLLTLNFTNLIRKLILNKKKYWYRELEWYWEYRELEWYWEKNERRNDKRICKACREKRELGTDCMKNCDW